MADANSTTSSKTTSFVDSNGATISVERAKLIDYAAIKSEQLVAATQSLGQHACNSTGIDARTLESLCLQIQGMAFDLDAMVNLIAHDEMQRRPGKKGGA